jgi:hypothetical protein
MPTFLDQVIERTRADVDARAKLVPVEALEERIEAPGRSARGVVGAQATGTKKRQLGPAQHAKSEAQNAFWLVDVVVKIAKIRDLRRGALMLLVLSAQRTGAGSEDE